MSGQFSTGLAANLEMRQRRRGCTMRFRLWLWGRGIGMIPAFFLAVSVQALRVLYDLLPEVDFIVCQFAPGHYRSSGNMA